MALSDPRGIAKSHVLDLESYSKVVKLWHKFKRDKTSGRRNYANLSNVYKQIVDLEQPHNNRVSEFMQQTETRVLESINKECVDMKEIRTNVLRGYYDISNIFKYFLKQPKKALQLKNDRYEDGLIGKRLFWEENNVFILVSSTRKMYNIANKSAFLVPILALLGAIPTAMAQHSGLVMLPSKITDYPSNNAKTIQVQVANAYRDSIGYYHVQGEVTNMGNSTISSVHVTVHFYNSNNQLIGDADGYTSPSNLDAGHT